MKTSDNPPAQALQYLTRALAILDDSNVPADIGAHVEAAITRLSNLLIETGEVAQKASL